MSMPRRLFHLAWLLACLLPALATAENLTDRWGLGVDSGLMKLIGGYYDYSNLDQYLTVQARRGLSDHWSLELALRYGWVRPGVASPAEQARWSLSGENGLYTVIWQPWLGLRYLVLPERRLSPFIGVSLGWTSWSVKDQRGKDGPGLSPDGPVLTGYDEDGNLKQLDAANFTSSLAIGAEFFLSPDWALDFGTRWHLLLGNNLDNIGYSATQSILVDANSSLVEGFLGVTHFFGSYDSDRDGIPNRTDACPRAREDFDGYEDTDGCPDRDNDLDGLADAVDRCPNEPEDYDGFADEDGCPDPDNDGDGVADTADQCPDEAEDRDGFADSDGCPDPDNDGDGVADVSDECQDTPAGVRVDAKGCPPEIEVTPFDAPMVLEGVNFQSGNDTLTPESMTVLRNMAESLLGHPTIQVEIQGHTDDAGSAEANRELSFRRAVAVRSTLIQMGVDPARMTAVGFGEDFPIAPNTTPEGRAKNRRVEIRRIDR
jgi:outer membrane protein OmpA-like peptidoglycan-associated protein